MPSSLRLGFDLDGVLADMDGALAEIARRAAGSPADETPLPRLSVKQQRELWDRVAGTQDFWAGLREIEAGTVARLGRAIPARRWEVVFLTRRPPTAGDTVQLQSQKWLRAHGVEYPSVVVTSASRGKVASALGLDLVVDDLPENCLDVVTDSDAKALLVWRADEELVPRGVKRMGIGVVRSLAECLDLLEELETPEPSGWMERLKKWLQR